MRVFRGTGRALVSWTPYWNQHMYENLTGETIERSLFESPQPFQRTSKSPLTS